MPPLITVAAPVFRVPPPVLGVDGVDGVEGEDGVPPPVTRTVQTAFLLPSVTRMWVIPAAMGVTLPLLSTEAMPGSSLIQV